MASKPPKMAGVEEASRFLGVSTATVWRLIRDGRLPSFRQGGRRLISRSALEAHRRQAPSGVRSRSAGGAKPVTRDHPIFRLVGGGRSGGAGPGSSDKHALLDE